MSELKYDHTDAGFCRVYYTWRNSQGQKIWYCAQEGRPDCDVEFLRCCSSLEPEYEVFPKEAPPLSPGKTSTDKIVNKWIRKKWSEEEAKEDTNKKYDLDDCPDCGYHYCKCNPKRR